MSTITIDGCTLHYELHGRGPTVVLTPGGRVGMLTLQGFASELAKHFQVLGWDRRNTGASDVSLAGDASEQELWADDLAVLIERLGLAPAYLAGGSAGCRVSVLTAIRHPRVVRGLALWSVSGGAYGSQILGYQYHVPYIQAAQRGGMQAVAETPFFAERIAANPANRERLLAIEPAEFIAVMRRWNEMFYPRPDTPMVGATAAQLRAITVPTLIVEGNDDIHPADAAETLHRLIPGSQLVPSPWSGDEFMARMVGRTQGTVFDLYPRLVPLLSGWLIETERRQVAAARG